MIDAKLRLFIPSRAIALPVPLASAFDGDGRGFSYDEGTARAEIWVDIDNTPNPAQAITVKNIAFGRTARYPVDAVTDVGGKPFWWKDLKRDPFLQLEPAPEAEETLGVTPDTLSVTGRYDPGVFGLTPQVNVRFHVVGANPLEPLAPPFNCDLDLVVSATPLPAFSYSLKGSHDGFPCYEFYLNRRLVYSYDPVAAGSTPFALFAIGGIPVDVAPTLFL